MFKNLFKAAKKALKNPIVQLGIGALLPQTAMFGKLAQAAPILANPAVLQGGIGLLAGDKPENVLRNVAYGTALGGIQNLGKPGGFMGGAKEYLGMTPQEPVIDYSSITGMEGSPELNAPPVKPLPDVKKPGFLQGLIKNTKVITNPDGSQSVVPVTDFFEKYGTLLKLGSVGATVAAAAMSDKERELFYDPTKNPYLASGSGSKDFYQDINPYYGMNQGGVASFAKGGMDNLRKSGMVYGPGGPKDDLIDAKLSNGEFVFTAAAVDRAGGPQAMYKLMNSLDPESEKPGESRGIERV